MEKRICLIYANCQNALIANYLRSSEFFNQEYIIKRLAVHSLIASEKSISDKILQQTKLFIYQPVKDIHGKRSSNYLLRSYRPTVKKSLFHPFTLWVIFPSICKNPTIMSFNLDHRLWCNSSRGYNIISMLEQRSKVKQKLLKN